MKTQILTTVSRILLIISACLVFFISISPLHALQPKVVLAKDIEIWTESFGDKKNPAVLLIMGSGGQGLLWPQQFCEDLASKGYYVIRYDNRDTGLSSSFDFKTSPYTLLDLAKDAVSILDAYGIKKANVVGASMGGEVGMLLAAHYPERVSSLSLIMTTTDMKPAFSALQGQAYSSALSGPKSTVIEAAKKMSNPPKTLKEQIEMFVETSKINAGTKVPVDEAMIRELGLQAFIRMKNPAAAANHYAATMASYQLHEEAASKIKAPTIIIHGDQRSRFWLGSCTSTE